MRNVNTNCLTSTINQSVTGNTLDTNQWVAASFHAYFSTAMAAGTLKLQASNDINTTQYNTQGFQPTNWVDIPNQSATITSGTSAILTVANSAYRWLRAIYTTSAAGTQTVAPVADTGVFASTVVHVPSTASAAQADYVVLSTTTGAKVALWLDIDAAGTAPTGAAYVAAGTKIKVSIVTGGTAANNGALLQAALNAIGGYTAVDNLDGTVTATQTLLGPVTAPARHNAGDSGNGSFSFTGTVGGTASNLQSKYFLLQDEASAHLYYVWINVSSMGVDPLVAGRTAVPIAITAGASAATIGTALASAIGALNSSNSFTATGTTTVTITNKVVGPFTPASDGTAATGFTFAVTAGGASTVNVNVNALSV